MDVTWNDSPSDSLRNDYFMLTDDQLKQKTAGSSDSYAHDGGPLIVY